MTHEEFIKAIATYAKKYAPQYDIKVISPIIAQAINESGWGTSLLASYHNYFGLKCRKTWTGPSVNINTKEEYSPGQITNIVDRFRVFSSMEAGVKGYFDFLFEPGVTWYNNLKGVTDPYLYAKLIKDDGYCTISDYTDKLITLINQYNLTQYDNFNNNNNNNNGGGTTMSDVKLYLIAGHGAGDPGAGGNGYSEATEVRRLAQTMKNLAPNNVILGDFNRNYYADGGLNSLNVDKNTYVMELHLDSAAASARGGHVIIKYGYNPDWLDTALAQKITARFPGRANSIVGRSDLANVNRAAARGINYRLIENCFITNADDMKKFTEADYVATAKNLLAAAGINVDSKPVQKPQEVQVPRNVVTANFDSNDKYQYWFMRYDEIKDGAIVAFRNQGSWDWLSDPGSSKEAGTQAQCWGGQNGTDGNQDPREPQLMILEATDKPGVWKIHPKVAPNLSLDTNGNNPAAGTKIQFWTNNKSEAQEFFLFNITGNLFRIVSCSGMKCLTLK